MKTVTESDYIDYVTHMLDEANQSNWICVTDISPKRAKWLLSHSRRDVKNFKPDYIRKALRSKPDANCIFGLFNKYDRKNALALCTVIRDYGPVPGCVYLHELTGFTRGGCGKRLTTDLIRLFGKVWCQCGLDETDPNNLKLNDSLADGVYRKIPGFKEYIVQNSIWKCPANFFYYGIDDAVMAKFLEDSYNAVKTENR